MTQLDTSGKELVSIPGVSVSHLLNGDSTPLANGILSLQLIKIELPSRAASPTPVDAKGKGTGPPPLPPRLPRAQDEWLLLTLVTHAGDVEPVLELPVPSSSRILSAPPSSYIIPNTQPGVDESTSGFFKITLPSTVETEARETFEAVLWGLTGFSSPTSEASVTSPKPTPVHDKDLRSKLVLVDDQGTVLGAIGDGQAGESLAEDPSLSLENQGLHEKEPVVVEASQGSGNAFNFTVRPLSKFEPTPNPSGSSIINAADFISRGIVVGAEMIGRTMEYGADRYTNSRKATDAPIVFSPTTTKSIQTTHAYTGKVVKVSAKTAATIGSLANGVGDKIGKSLGIQSTPSGKTPTGLRGLVNKSLVAVNVVLDSVETGGKSLLASGTKSTTQVVGHAYGPEAAKLSSSVGGSVQHVALVYIDARGVSRKALLKSIGKSAIRAKMPDGSVVTLTDDGTGKGGLQMEAEKAGLNQPPPTYSTPSHSFGSTAVSDGKKKA